MNSKQETRAAEAVAQVPYYVHEGEMWRLERINKRLMIGTVALTAILVISNLLWAIKLF